MDIRMQHIISNTLDAQIPFFHLESAILVLMERTFQKMLRIRWWKVLGENIKHHTHTYLGSENLSLKGLGHNLSSKVKY